MKLLKQILNITLGIFIFGLVPVVLFIFVTSRSPMLFNIRSYVVMTGSMKPTLPVGSMVFTSPKPAYKVGDIITFQRGNITVTHRIHNIIDGHITTKGDANNTVDSQTITQSDIIGRDIIIIPFIGRVSGFIKTPLGFILLLGVPTLLFVAYEFWQIKKEFEKMVEKRVLDKMLQQNPVHSLEL